MFRYFIELAYKGTNYSGFQSQHNTKATIQAEIEKSLETLLKEKIVLTGSSRTDAGVHALQNYFQFDRELPVEEWKGVESLPRLVYKMNAVLPDDIAVKKVLPVSSDAHCRYDALSRSYAYYIHRFRDPFLRESSYYFPYKLDTGKMDSAAAMVKGYRDFTSFSKRNTQAKTFLCEIYESGWEEDGYKLVYRVRANRFLRGMVRALTATMLLVGREKISLEEFKGIIEAKDCTKANFAAPAQGLFLEAVSFPEDLFR